MKIDQTKPVLLTGATGYLAGRIAERLLEMGVTIHAPIRNPDNPDKTKYLDAIAEKSKGSIKYFKADLLDNGSYKKAMQGCELVIHTASPFIMNTKDPQKDLVDPAVNGTKNVLDTVNQTESVKRVVLTSSVVSIYGNNKDLLDYPNQTITEAQWNTTSSLTSSPYNYSKVLAEKKAWEINKAQKRWDLVVINPSFILGPGINPFGTSESFNIVKQMGDGSMKMGTGNLAIGAVDVRDVAKAHVLAGFTPSANGRNIISAENQTFLGLAQMLEEKYGSYPLPKKTLPKWLMWLMGPLGGIPRNYISNNVNYAWKADNSKAVKELGMTYIPIKQTMNEFFGQMVDNGVFKK